MRRSPNRRESKPELITHCSAMEAGMVRSHLPWIGLIKRLVGTAGLLGCVVMLCSTQLLGQLSTASLNGVVRDSSGAVIPNATVTLTAVETSVRHVTQSNGSGDYVFTSLTPG